MDVKFDTIPIQSCERVTTLRHPLGLTIAFTNCDGRVAFILNEGLEEQLRAAIADKSMHPCHSREEANVPVTR